MHVTAAAFESQTKSICWCPPCLTMSSNELAILEEFEQRFQRLENTVKMLIWTSCARTCQCFSPFLERSGNLRSCWESVGKSRGNYKVRPTCLPEGHREEGRYMWWPIFSHVYEQQEVENVDQTYGAISVVWDGRSASQQIFTSHVRNFYHLIPFHGQRLRGSEPSPGVQFHTWYAEWIESFTLGIHILTLWFNTSYVSVRRFKDLCGENFLIPSCLQRRLITKNFRKCSKSTCLGHCTCCKTAFSLARAKHHHSHYGFVEMCLKCRYNMV